MNRATYWGLIALLFFTGSVNAADTRQTVITQSTAQATDAQRAQAWRLDSREWERYETIMRGPRGLWSAELDPLWVLGIHAQTETERTRYAEMAVQQEHDRIERELAFQREWTAAWKRLYGNEPMIDVSKLGLGVDRGRPSVRPSVRGTGSQVYLFVSSSECPQCDSTVRKSLRQVRQTSGMVLHIFLSGTDRTDWIRRQGMASLVRAGRVIVQPAGDVLKKLMAGKPLPTLPYTVVR